MVTTIVLPSAPDVYRTCWEVVADLAEADLPGWVLAGGLMVHLHGYLRVAPPSRATTDVDLALDVRGDRSSLNRVTGELVRQGFALDGRHPTGKEHRWRRPRDGAVIDVIVPTGLHPGRAPLTVAGGETVESHGVQAMVDHRSEFLVEIGDRKVSVPAPTLLGAILGKAGAVGNVDSRKSRHLEDLSFLVPLIRPGDLRGVTLGPAQRRRVLSLRARLEAHHTVLEPSVLTGLAMLEQLAHECAGTRT